ncbi:hypothetical protein BH11PLA1_BH11PLA1_15720 [soil metagenome]
MQSPSFQSACLAVGLVAAWAPIADADVMTEVRVELNLTSDTSHLSNARLMVCNSSGAIWDTFSAASLPGLGSGSFMSQQTFDPATTQYALVGISHGSGGPYLMVSFAHLTQLNASFESIFPGVSEQGLMDMLLTNDPGVDGFLMSHFSTMGQFSGQTSEAYHFSNATPIGSITVTVTAIPGPGGLALALPAALLAFRRRRRTPLNALPSLA